MKNYHSNGWIPLEFTKYLNLHLEPHIDRVVRGTPGRREVLDWAVVPWAGSVSSPQAENGWHERGESESVGESKMGTFSKKVEPLQTPWVSY